MSEQMGAAPTTDMSATTAAEPGAASSSLPHSAPGQSKTTTPNGVNESFDVKVNGKIVKMSRQEVLDHASMSHAANAKFNEAKADREKANAILSKAKSNPIEALIDAGLSREQIRDTMEKWYTKEFIEPEGMSEAEKKLRAAEERLKNYEEQEKTAKEKREQDEMEAMTTKERGHLQNQIIEAMESSGLPKTKFFVSRMAFYMKQNLVNGWDAPIPAIVRQVKDEYKGLNAGITQDSTVEQLIELFGEGVINKIRKHDLEQLRAKRNLPPPANQSAQNTSRSNERVTSAEVNRRLRAMRMGQSI